jgi:hypothetical protein
MESKYNGFSNWHTWNCYLWLANDEESYRMVRKCFSSELIKIFWENFFEGEDGIETCEVNFDEIYELINEE